MTPTRLGVSEQSLIWREEVQRVTELHHPTLLHPSPSPAPSTTRPSSDVPSKLCKVPPLALVFKPGKKIICHFSLWPTNPSETSNNHKVPHRNCWQGLSFSSNEKEFLPSSHSLFPSAHEETLLAPSSGRGQLY